MRVNLKRNVCSVAVVCLLLLAGPAVTRATTLEEYRGLIAECRKATEKKQIPGTEIDALCARLIAINTVTYPGGGSVTINTRPLVAALRRLPAKDPSRARFVVLEALITASGETEMPGKGDPRTLAEKVLADKEFAGLRKTIKPVKSVVPGWWVRFTSWAKEMAERFSAWLKNLSHDRPTPASPDLSGVKAFVKFLQFLLYFVLCVAALVALYLLVRAISARGWFAALRKRRKSGGDSDLDLDLSGDGIPDPLGAARTLAAQGAYREAVRMAYIASLRRLQENGLLVLEPNKTNWEYQRGLRRRSRAASDTLLPATRLFDRVWYGRRVSTAEEFSEAVRVHDALQALGEILDDSAPDPDEAAELTGIGAGKGKPT